MLNYIDISTEKKKKEIYDLFLSFKSKDEVYKYFGKNDNSSNIRYINNIGKEIGFDFNFYNKKREVRKCKKCGKPFYPKYEEQIFCCRSCANSFNNYGKKMKDETKKKIRNKLILYYEPKKNAKESNRRNSKKQCKGDINRKLNYCLNCGKQIRCGGKFCSNECSSMYKHKKAYEDFINNNEKYCRGNYSPIPFKVNFLEEQGGVCAICGIEPIWNGKPLVFVLDHIDGDASNNKRENLRLICPHCDSQLPTFKSKNKHSTRRNYWREKILREINDK